jgi:hypothetical protein
MTLYERIDEANGWTLQMVEQDGERVLEAAKPVPYDGTLRFSTRDRANSTSKNSQFRLTVDDVVRQYVLKSETGRDAAALRRDAERALAGDEPESHAARIAAQLRKGDSDA